MFFNLGVGCPFLGKIGSFYFNFYFFSSGVGCLFGFGSYMLYRNEIKPAWTDQE